MLPPYLEAMKKTLETKGISKRTTYEDQLLEDLKEADGALGKAKAKDKSLTESIEKRASARSGPISGMCPTCGK